jgi:hypothetical protein
MTYENAIAMRPKEAATYTGLTEQRLAHLRYSGGGCPFVRIGRSVSYLKSDLDAWLRANRRASTSDPGSPQPIAA